MANGDTYTYTENGKTISYTVAPTTAQGNEELALWAGQDALKKDDAARAAAAGVTSVEFIDYAEALVNYETRSDTELLVNRRARENAVTFHEQDFARQTVQIAHPAQNSTVGTTSVVAGDNYADTADAGTQDDVAVAPRRASGTPTDPETTEDDE
jgi:hypothetical protein